MKLFSKRNNRGDKLKFDILRSRSLTTRDTNPFYYERIKREIVNASARTRLVSLTKFLTSSDSFLEKYVLIDDRKDKIHYLNKRFIDDFSESELGYKFSDFFTFYPFSFKGESLNNEKTDEKIKLFNDYYLFDLIETIMLFSKQDQRKDVTNRIKQILEEEKTGYSIKESIITKDSGENLQSLSSQLKDLKLARKINSYYSFIENDDFVNSSKICSEILNIIISDEKKKQISNNKQQEKLKCDPMQTYKNINEYIKGESKEVKALIAEMRALSKKLVPKQKGRR